MDSNLSLSINCTNEELAELTELLTKICAFWDKDSELDIEKEIAQLENSYPIEKISYEIKPTTSYDVIKLLLQNELYRYER